MIALADENDDWTNELLIKERIIDNRGWFFDLQIADINADGRDDILVSTWRYNNCIITGCSLIYFVNFSHGLKQGSVAVYEIPCDFARDEWRKHILIDGAVDMPLPELGSGGKVNAFHPVTRHGRAPL